MRRRRREAPLTAEEQAFFDGFVDATSAEDCRRSRNSYLDSAIRDARMALAQHLRFEKKYGVELAHMRAWIERSIADLVEARRQDQ